jgi:hypothetical protein
MIASLDASICYSGKLVAGQLKPYKKVEQLSGRLQFLPFGGGTT